MNVVHYITALIGIPLKGQIDLDLPNGSKEEAIKYLHDPYLLAAMNPLVYDDQPTAGYFRRLEKSTPIPAKPDYRMLTVNEIPKNENGFTSVFYRQHYGIGTGSVPFEMIARDISPISVEVYTRGSSVRMTETYTVYDDRVEKKVKVPRYFLTTNIGLEEGLEWNSHVWRLGPWMETL